MHVVSSTYITPIKSPFTDHLLPSHTHTDLASLSLSTQRLFSLIRSSFLICWIVLLHYWWYLIHGVHCRLRLLLLTISSYKFLFHPSYSYIAFQLYWSTNRASDSRGGGYGEVEENETICCMSVDCVATHSSYGGFGEIANPLQWPQLRKKRRLAYQTLPMVDPSLVRHLLPLPNWSSPPRTVAMTRKLLCLP